MKAYLAAISLVIAVLCGEASAQTGSPPGGTIEHIGPLSPSGQLSDEPLAQVPALTLTQRAAILSSVTLDKTKRRASENFNVGVGEPVPARVALHPLPNAVLAEAPGARPYRYTLMGDQVVLVDPLTMRVVDVIKP